MKNAWRKEDIRWGGRGGMLKDREEISREGRKDRGERGDQRSWDRRSKRGRKHGR